MRVFDHVGIPSDVKRPRELYVSATKVWVTDPAQDPRKIEYLRFEPDSPVSGPLRDLPHIAFRVDNLEAAMADSEILLGPFQPTDTLRVAFVLRDGAVFEFMENRTSSHWFPTEI